MATNDRLAAQVAVTWARPVDLLSDVDGFYFRNPSRNATAHTSQ